MPESPGRLLHGERVPVGFLKDRCASGAGDAVVLKSARLTRRQVAEQVRLHGSLGLGRAVVRVRHGSISAGNRDERKAGRTRAGYWISLRTPGALPRRGVGAISNCGPVLNAQARALANCVLGDHVLSEDRAAPPPMRATCIKTISPASSQGNLQAHRSILRSGRWPPRHPGHELMILKLTREDATELRKALEVAHTGILRELSGLAGCGYSPKGVDLCHRRSRLEQLLALIERRPEVQTMPQPAIATPRAAIASFRPGSYKTKNPRQGMSTSFPIRALQAQAPGVLRDSPFQRVLGAVGKPC